MNDKLDPTDTTVFVAEGSMSRDDAKSVASWRASTPMRLVIRHDWLVVPLVFGTGLALVTVSDGPETFGVVEFVIVLIFAIALLLISAGGLAWRRAFSRHGAHAGYYTADRSTQVRFVVDAKQVQVFANGVLTQTFTQIRKLEVAPSGLFFQVEASHAPTRFLSFADEKFFIPTEWFVNERNRDRFVEALRQLSNEM